MFNLSPKNDKFYELFISFSEIIDQSAKLLKEFTDNMNYADEKFKKIKDVEHDGDQKLHEIFEELNKSFITPLDREDIFAIGKALDDVIDFIEATASRYLMFNLEKSNEEAVIMCNLVVESTGELVGLMNSLKEMNKGKKLMEKIVEINRIENEGDAAFRKAVRELFSGQASPIEIMIWKEIYESFENILDACEDVANIIEGVVMKNA